MLEIKKLVKQYVSPDGKNITALRVEHLRVEREEQVAVAGPSGSGKTTLLHLIAGLLVPTEGEIHLDGQRIDQLAEKQRDAWRARNVGYVFQNFHLLPGLTALENVMAAMAFAKVVKVAEQRQRAITLLTAVGLADRVQHRPHQLSTGEQQRVAVARALANRPRLILADEPTASLDDDHGANVLELLLRLCKEHGSMLILATHDRAVMEIFPRVIELQRQRKEDTNASTNSVA